MTVKRTAGSGTGLNLYDDIYWVDGEYVPPAPVPQTTNEPPRPRGAETSLPVGSLLSRLLDQDASEDVPHPPVPQTANEPPRPRGAATSLPPGSPHSRALNKDAAEGVLPAPVSQTANGPPRPRGDAISSPAGKSLSRLLDKHASGGAPPAPIPRTVIEPPRPRGAAPSLSADSPISQVLDHEAFRDASPTLVPQPADKPPRPRGASSSLPPGSPFSRLLNREASEPQEAVALLLRDNKLSAPAATEVLRQQPASEPVTGPLPAATATLGMPALAPSSELELEPTLPSGEMQPSASDHTQPSLPVCSLEEALQESRIEFWYQPKISLQTKQLVGVEAFARIRNSDDKTHSVGPLIASASSETVVNLTERALVSALITSVNLCEIGVDIRLAINVCLDAMIKLPILNIVRRHRPRGGKNLNLVFDMVEWQVIGNLAEIGCISENLRACGFSIAVDDFGSSLLAMLQHKDACAEKIDQTFQQLKELKNVNFAEMKLDRNLVRNCDADGRKREICKNIIDLTHNFGGTAVAVGIETAAELHMLQELGCDIGQGYFFGPPMSENSFLDLLWKRGVKSKIRRAKAAS